MEEGEGGLSFDFEGGLDAPFRPGDAESAPDTSLRPQYDRSFDHGQGQIGNYHHYPAPGRRGFRQTVCRHWLRSLCMKGENCGFLHQFDKERMPICRFFRIYGECREQDCPYKHTAEDVKECNMYKLGFCPNGIECRYKHTRLPGPPPPVEEIFQKLQQTNPSFWSINRFFQSRNTGYLHQGDNSQIPSFSGAVSHSYQSKQIVSSGPSIQLSQPPLPTQPMPQQQQQGQQVSQNQLQVAQNGSSQSVRSALPLPQGQSRYFIVKSCNRENLELSVQQGVWATQRSNEAKLNEAFDSSQNVILIFSINRTRHFQGCAKMTSRIGGFFGGGNWKHAHGTAHYGRNFSVNWLKLGELSFFKTRHLRNPYNENMPVKISRDCQELEPSIGEQLASLLYLEPDSELMAMLVEAESKREEEKAKGVEMEDTAENPDIVPFEDEEEEEESEEDEDAMGLAARGRGLMWPPHMMGRGMRPMMGLRGFPPMMVGPDGFSYDQFNPPFFQPFPGPRFPGMAQRPPVFPGMMMAGGGRPPFGSARGLRPMGGPPLLRPPSTGSRGSRRDQRWDGNDQSDRHDAGSDHDSGDEVSRRSRHEDGKRRRRGPEGETLDQWESSS